ncbi:hypothetical protein KAX17_15720, partial [Candidatus Bipolaricaulota bacterium]|nr:hypothetical protein [Candidatus Bipolaricaulota bacterium]
MGAALFSGYLFQTWGLTYTAVTKSGLITGLSAVIVPVISSGAVKKRVHISVWFGALLTRTLRLKSVSEILDCVLHGDHPHHGASVRWAVWLSLSWRDPHRMAALRRCSHTCWYRGSQACRRRSHLRSRSENKQAKVQLLSWTDLF